MVGVKCGGDERGAALLVALAATALLTAIAAALIVSVSTEMLITGSFRAGQEALYGADAGLERAIHDLAAIPDWTAVLSSPPARAASFDDGVGVGRAPDGRPLVMGVLRSERQAVSNATYGASAFGPDNPVWQLFGRASLAAILPPGAIGQPAYVLVWVADDGLDGDGDPSRDGNGQIVMHVDAYGVNGARRGIEAAIARAGPAGVRLLAWKETR
jgi:hypothetical protein